MGPAVHEVVAVKFAHHARGARSAFFLRPPPGTPDVVPIDYLVWLIRPAGRAADRAGGRGADHVVVFDTGFRPAVADARRRSHYVARPAELLGRLGVDCAAVPLVVLSHLHYDHAGDVGAFASARFVLQRDELRFWTGPYASRGEHRRHVEPDDILDVVRLNLEGRLHLVEGSEELVPGVEVHHVGGHTPGTQVLRVETATGPLVLACDASHLAANVRDDAPMGVYTDLPAVYAGFDRMVELAGGDVRRVVPGHDPAVLAAAAPVPGLEGLAGIVA